MINEIEVVIEEIFEDCNYIVLFGISVLISFFDVLLNLNDLLCFVICFFLKFLCFFNLEMKLM